MAIEKREIVKCVLLSLVTCGIYGIIWAVKMGREAVSVKDANDAGTLEIVLMLFVPFLGYYLAEKKLFEGASAKGIQISDNSILYLVLGLFGLGLIDMILMQTDLNKIADFTQAPPTGGFYDATNINPQA